MTKARERDTYSKPSTGTVKTGKWSNAELSTIVRMANKGSAPEEIAAALTRTVGGVLSQMSGHKVRSKLIRKPPTTTVHREVIGLALDLLKLRKSQCRWPCGEFFCKMNHALGSPYCAEHRKKALQTGVRPLNLKGLLS